MAVSSFSIIEHSFGGQRNLGKIEYVTIPYSNCSQSIKDSWFVSSYTHVPTKNGKIIDTHIGGDSKIWAR